MVAWNYGRIKASVEGSYNKDEVVRAANVIAALANAGLGSLFVPGTETAKGWHATAGKPALFSDGAKVGELAGNFNKEANELARVAVLPQPWRRAFQTVGGRITRLDAFAASSLPAVCSMRRAVLPRARH